jgi:hypothetical protein
VSVDFKSIAFACTASVLVQFSAGLNSQAFAADECLLTPNHALCIAYRLKASRVAEIANLGREQWAKVAYLYIENPLPPLTMLPDGMVLNIYSGALRIGPSGRSTDKDRKASTETVVATWRSYSNAIFEHNLRGQLTYDIYPCQSTCEGHEEGYKWAEKQDIREHQECQNNSKSFQEGCFVWVTRHQGRTLLGNSAQTRD